MKNGSEENSVLFDLLSFELATNAKKFGFISQHDSVLDHKFILRCVSELDSLSLLDNEMSHREVVAISSLLWTYGKENWPGLKNYLILFLSRIGFGPSSIMLDSNFDFKEKNYEGLSSIINEFAITLNQLKYEIYVKDKIFLLTEFQKKVWDEIEVNKLLGISAPTSAGKSFIIALKAIDLMFKAPGNIIYIVPTLSLVSQVAFDFRSLLKDFEIKDYDIETTFNIDNHSVKKIYVLTQEKAIAAFSQSLAPFKHIRFLVIDEIQNVERVTAPDDQRAKILYDLMIEIKNTSVIDHIILAGPRINNLDELGTDIFSIDAQKAQTRSSPVTSLTYAICKRQKEFYFKIYCELFEKPLEIKIENPSSIKGYGVNTYSDEYLSFMSDFVNKIDTKEANIVFAPTTSASRRIAAKLAGHLSESESQHQNYLNGLSQFIANTVHPKFALSDIVKKGVVYHHGKLPHHIRAVIEHGIRKQQIKNIVCTTTLLQGVNLPVQNIIVRNPNLFTIRNKKGGEPKLTNYETANLRGRAGRLLKDFIGRTYILDETSFQKEEGNSPSSLLNQEGKSLKVGYRERFEQHKSEIRNDLRANVGHTPNNKEYAYLTTYIRQVVMKHGQDSMAYLAQVGIQLQSEDVSAIQSRLRELNISQELCSINRYWDPFDLAFLSKVSSEFDIPTGVNEMSISQRLKILIEFFRDKMPIYYEQYFKIEEIKDKDMILSKCIMAEKWLKGDTLTEILADPYYSDSDKIEDAVKFIQDKISYGLPMLLKPLYDLKAPQSMFPRFIEMGAYLPETRKLIELNVPRETAIYLSKNFSFSNMASFECLNQLRRIYQNLPYWYKIQIETII